VVDQVKVGRRGDRRNEFARESQILNERGSKALTRIADPGSKKNQGVVALDRGSDSPTKAAGQPS
jgi:hypothetical protein